MSKGPFEAQSFIPTRFSTAEEKAKFGNNLLDFIASDWKDSLFTKSFYNRLSNCFGHIAHYVEGVIMRSVDEKTAWERRSDTKSLRIITGVPRWCQSRGSDAWTGASLSVGWLGECFISR